MAEYQIPGRLITAPALFRIIPGLNISRLAGQFSRRDRWVLLLLDGERTQADLARLTHRSEPDVAYTLIRFFQSGYIEQVGQSESGHRS
jgi:hypothetical protein